MTIELTCVGEENGRKIWARTMRRNSVQTDMAQQSSQQTAIIIIIIYITEVCVQRAFNHMLSVENLPTTSVTDFINRGSFPLAQIYH